MLEYLQMYPEKFAMVKRYPPEDRCHLYEAMAQYAFAGEEPDWPESDMKWLIWEALRQKVDAIQRFQEKQRDNGNKGGRPKTQRNPTKPNETQTNPSKPNETQTNPDKPSKTPESESDSESDSESESEKEPRERICAEQSSAPVATLPLVDGSEYGITEEELAKDVEAYPALDVRQEYLMMGRWFEANPKNRKTRSGIRRFINSWLSRSQDRARPTSTARAAPGPRPYINPYDNMLKQGVFAGDA